MAGTRLKVKQILNANSSDSWNTLASKFIEGARNQVVSSNKNLAGSMAIFGTTMKIYSGVMTVLSIVQTAVPLINLAVKIVGSITNPVLIGSIIQDLAMMIIQLSSTFVNTAIIALKELILNYEFFFPGVEPEKIVKVQDAVNTTSLAVRDAANTALDNVSPAPTANEQMDVLGEDIVDAFDTLDLLINAHLAALDPSGHSASTWRTLITNTVRADLNNSTIPTGLELGDDDIYEYILNQITSFLNTVETAQRNEMTSIDVNITKLTIGYENTAIMSLNKLKTIYMDMKKEAEIMFKRQVYEQTTYKEDPDIKLLLSTFSAKIADEIEKKKIKYFKDVNKIIDTSDDIETIRTNAISIIFEHIYLYDLFSLAVLQPIKLTMVENGKAADLYDTDHTLNDIYMKAASTIFNDLLPTIVEYVISRNTLVKGDSFDTGEVSITGLSTLNTDTTAYLVDYITNMGTFNLPLIYAETTSYLNSYVFVPSINDTICDKLLILKSRLYKQMITILNDEVVNRFFDLFTVVYPAKFNERERLIIGNYILDSARLFARETLKITHGVIYLNEVPCRNCTSCDGLKATVNTFLSNIKLVNLKVNMNEYLADSLSNFDSKVDALSFLNAPTTLTSMDTLRDNLINIGVYDSILEATYYDQEWMMINAIANKIRI